MKKKLLCLALAVMMAAGLSACAPAQTGKPSATPAASEPGETKLIKMTTCLVYGDASDNVEMKEQFQVEFEKVTGYKFELNALPREDYITKLNLLAVSGSLTGIVRGFSPEDTMRFRSDGVITSLESLRNNTVFQAFPEEMKTLYEYDDTLWGIPSGGGGTSGSMFTRHYRKDWLDNLGLKVPRTIDEFYEVMRAFTFDDPNKNGVDDTFGFTSRNTWIIQDIFQAFDARLDNTGGGPIYYDHLEKRFTDRHISPNMVECLEFLAKCYAEGIMDPESFTNTGAQMRDRLNDGIAGSAFYWLNAWEQVTTSDSIRERDKFAAPTGELFVQTVGLQGKRTKKTNGMGYGLYGGVPLMLTANTPGGEQMMHYFVDAFFGSEIGNLFGNYGVEGVSWKRGDNGWVIRLNDEEGNPKPTAGIVGAVPAYDTDKIPVVVDGTAEYMKAQFDFAERTRAFLKEAGKDPLVWSNLGGDKDYETIVSETWEKLSTDISTAFQECYAQAITGSISPLDAVVRYCDLMRSIGAEKVIDEVNAYYGFEAQPFQYIYTGSR